MKFSALTHNLKYHYYCEVVISPKGNIYYARPSHNDFLEKVACKKFNITKQELADRCPAEYWFNYNKWLCDITGYVCVWYHAINGTPNEAQLEAIKYLERNKCIDIPCMKQL